MIRRKDIELIRKGFHRHKPLIFLNENKPYFNKGEIRRGKKENLKSILPCLNPRSVKWHLPVSLGKH